MQLPERIRSRISAGAAEFAAIKVRKKDSLCYPERSGDEGQG
jgi:hypothetical protein